MSERNKIGRQCVFCGSLIPGKDRANEHIYPEWLLEAIAGRKRQYDMARQSLVMPFSRDHRQHSLNTFVAGRVCGICNNGWMNTLEGQVRPIFFRLRSAAMGSTSLTVSECKELGVWAVKTAMTLNAGTGFDPLFKATQYRYLKDHRRLTMEYYIDLIWHKEELVQHRQKKGALVTAVPMSQELLYSSHISQSGVVCYTAGWLTLRVLVHNNRLFAPISAVRTTQSIWPRQWANGVRLVRQDAAPDLEDLLFGLGLNVKPGAERWL